jgi:hypothetical protein
MVLVYFIAMKVITYSCGTQPLSPPKMLAKV